MPDTDSFSSNFLNMAAPPPSSFPEFAPFPEFAAAAAGETDGETGTTDSVARRPRARNSNSKSEPGSAASAAECAN